MTIRYLVPSARACEKVDQLCMQGGLQFGCSAVPKVVLLPRIRFRVIELCELDGIENVLSVPLNVRKVVRIVEDSKHAPLIVWVVVQSICTLENAIMLDIPFGELTRKPRPVAGILLTT